jgi:hypothetical protein
MPEPASVDTMTPYVGVIVEVKPYKFVGVMVGVSVDVPVMVGVG